MCTGPSVIMFIDHINDVSVSDRSKCIQMWHLLSPKVVFALNELTNWGLLQADVTQKPLSSVLFQRVFTYFHYYPLVITHGLLEDLKIPDLYR